MTIIYKKNKTLLFENEMSLTSMMKVKTTRPKIASPDMMEECGRIIDVEEGDKPRDRENKDEVHSNVNKNDTETTWGML